MIYLGMAFLVGIVAGAIHNIILFRHVMPYMKKRGFDPQGPLAAFQVNKAVAEYHRTDDPAERRVKILLRLLQIPFMAAFLIAAYGVFSIWKAARGE